MRSQSQPSADVKHARTDAQPSAAEIEGDARLIEMARTLHPPTTPRQVLPVARMDFSDEQWARLEAAAAVVRTPLRERLAELRAVVGNLLDAYDAGQLEMSSPEIGEPEVGIPMHPWHEEFLHHARAALANVTPDHSMKHPPELAGLSGLSRAEGDHEHSDQGGSTC